MRSDDPAAAGDTVRGDQDLWDEVFASQNLVTALKRVERNRGAAGVDGVETHELRGGADSIGSRPGRRWMRARTVRRRCVR